MRGEDPRYQTPIISSSHRMSGRRRWDPPPMEVEDLGQGQRLLLQERIPRPRPIPIPIPRRRRRGSFCCRGWRRVMVWLGRWRRRCWVWRKRWRIWRLGILCWKHRTEWLEKIWWLLKPKSWCWNHSTWSVFLPLALSVVWVKIPNSWLWIIISYPTLLCIFWIFGCRKRNPNLEIRKIGLMLLMLRFLRNKVWIHPSNHPIRPE